MSHTPKENEVRELVSKLRIFYRNCTVSGLVIASCILIWAFSGGGVFWPIWVMMGLGIFLLLEAKTLGILPVFKDLFPYLNPEWEEAEVKRRILESSKTNTTTVEASEKSTNQPTPKAKSEQISKAAKITKKSPAKPKAKTSPAKKAKATI